MSASDDPLPSDLPPIPPSPVFSYASTAAGAISSLNLPPPPPPPAYPYPILSQNDRESSNEVYSELLVTAKAYRKALAELANASSAFGSALEACAKLKEARTSQLPGTAASSNGDPPTTNNLMEAGGVHHLVANHQQILSETVYRSFELPLLDEVDLWKRRMEEEDVSYQKTISAKTKEIRQMEKKGLQLHKSRKRDVSAFRTHLVKLTGLLDEVTSMHTTHASTLLVSSQDTSSKVVDCASNLVRAELEIYESLARKGWSGGGLESLLDRSSDPFLTEAPENDRPNEMFSILPSKSILPSAGEEYGVGSRSGSRPASIRGVTEEHYQSLTKALTEYDDDERSIFSGKGIDDPRPARPFSPPPRVVATPAKMVAGSSNLDVVDEDETPRPQKDTLRVDGLAETDSDEPEYAIIRSAGLFGKRSQDMKKERRWSVSDDV